VRERERETDRQTDRERQSREREKQTERQIDRERERYYITFHRPNLTLPCLILPKLT
jgi:hypothetical protein